MKEYKTTSPPQRPLRLLSWFCPDDLYEEIEGDLIYKFNKDAKVVGEKRAKRRLIWNVIRFCRPGIVMRNKLSFELNTLYMLRSYFKMAFRHIMKSKTYSLINVMGLAVATVSFVLIAQYIGFELSYDRFHSNADQIYRIGLNRYTKGELQESSAKTFVGVRRLLKANFPEALHYTAFYKTPANTGFLFRYNQQMFNEDGGILNADSSFFEVFPSLLLKGDPATVLADPNNLIISESMARKIFGDVDPMGQAIDRIDDYDKGHHFVVTGVMKDTPANAHFHASFIRHIDDSWPDADDWKDGFIYTYVQFLPSADPKSIEIRMNASLKKLEAEHPLVKDAKVFIQPMSAIHLSSDHKHELEPGGNKILLYALAIIGVIILVMAWINYVNLETARFITRAKEVSVRRIIGSGKRDLMIQFVLEFLCLTLGALLVVAAILILFAPYLQSIMNVSFLDGQWLFNESIVTALIVFLCGTFIAGIYPAFFLVKLSPMLSLKGNPVNGNRGVFLRRSLVVVQFTASIVLIAIVLVITQQLSFMREADTKMSTGQVIVLENPMAYSNEELHVKYTTYKALEEKLMQGSMVKTVASSSAVPGEEIGFSYINLIKRTLNAPYDPTVYKTLFVNHQYIPAYDVKMVAGHNFADPIAGGKWMEPWQNKNWTTILLNEQAVKQLGFSSPEEAIDQVVHFQLFDDFEQYRIIGVVQDYHHEAIKKNVYPTIYALNHSTFQQVYYTVRLHDGVSLKQAISYIERVWKSTFPDRSFDYFFLDEYYQLQFRTEEQFKSVFSLFAGVAIFIACLGILGMTLFESNARLKEISIRKVLGASVSGLIALLSKAHLHVMIISALAAMPLIYFVAQQWLQVYPLRITLSPLVFLSPVVAILFMVGATSVFQTFRAATTNPVDHLKNE